jgi:predicted MFS family arabinose efflux permease
MDFPFRQLLPKLTSAPRAFLFFSIVNLISWQCIVGQVLVLFARSLAMPADLVGLLLSFIPLSMLLVVISIPAVEFFGPRKLLITSWLLRNVLVTAVFFIPVVTLHHGQKAAWLTLLLAVLGFSLARAFGVGGWYPWIHEIVPKQEFTDYFNSETILVQLVNILLAVLISRVLVHWSGLSSFYLIYGAGVVVGLFSVVLLVFMPGGRKCRTFSGKEKRFASFYKALGDKPYTHFIVVTSLALSSFMWVGSSSIMYLRDAMLFRDGQIMIMTAIGGVAVAFSIRYWSTLAERQGGNRVMAKILVLHAVSIICWLFLLPDSRFRFVLAVLALVSSMVFSVCFSTVAARSMLCRVQNEGRTGYTSLWIIGVSLSSGIPPILAGQLINHLGMTGFRLCFIFSILLGISVSFFLKRLPEEGELPNLPYLDILIRPLQPFRWLGRMTWVSLGFGVRRPATGRQSATHEETGNKFLLDQRSLPGKHDDKEHDQGID